MNENCSPKMPDFTVVVPCRDNGDDVIVAVESILTQEVEVEVIVVDDGSEPPLVAWTDHRVRLIRSEVSLGPAAARNLGIRTAIGRHIAFCDSDDHFAPGRLRSALELHSGADVVVMAQAFASSLSRSSDPPRRLTDVLHTTAPSLGATSVVRGRCPELDPRFFGSEDIEWWVRLIGQRPSFRSTSALGYVVGENARPRLLHSPIARLEFSYRLLELHSSYFDHERKARAFRWLRIAAMERREGSLGLAALALRGSFRAGCSTLQVKESLHLLAAALRRPPKPVAIGSRPLPPLAVSRAMRMEPLSRGSAESRLQFTWLALDAAVSLSRRLPLPLQRCIRSTVARLLRSRTAPCRTAWGLFEVGANEPELLARYTDEPVESALVARLVGRGDSVLLIGAGRGWYPLLLAQRVGASGSVVVVEAVGSQTERLERILHANGASDQVRVVEPSMVRGSARPPMAFIAESEQELLGDDVRPSENASKGSLQAATMSYSDLLLRCSLDHMSFLKVDVDCEGLIAAVAAGVLDAATRGSTRPTICFGVGLQLQHRGDLGTSILEAFSASYDLFFLSANGLEKWVDQSDSTSSPPRSVFAIPKGSEGDRARAVLGI